MADSANVRSTYNQRRARSTASPFVSSSRAHSYWGWRGSFAGTRVTPVPEPMSRLTTALPSGRKFRPFGMVSPVAQVLRLCVRRS